MTKHYEVTKDATGWNVVECTFTACTNRGDVLVTRDTHGAASMVRSILSKIDALDPQLQWFPEMGECRRKVTMPNAPVEELRKIERALIVLAS